MKFLIIFIAIIALIMIGVAVVLRKVKRFFSSFMPPQADKSFNNEQNYNDNVVYDDGKVRVYKGDK